MRGDAEGVRLTLESRLLLSRSTTSILQHSTTGVERDPRSLDVGSRLDRRLDGRIEGSGPRLKEISGNVVVLGDPGGADGVESDGIRLEDV